VLLTRDRRTTVGALLAVALAGGIATAQDALKRRGNALLSARLLVPTLEALARERVPIYRYHVGRLGAYYYRTLSRKLPEVAPTDVLRADTSSSLAVVAEGRDPGALVLGARDRVANVTRRAVARGRYVLVTLRAEAGDP
jgi:hypothetical protein